MALRALVLVVKRPSAALSAQRRAASSTSTSPSPSTSPSASSSVANHLSFLSTSARLREPSAIRALQPLLSVPGMISLGGGMPSSSMFPFARVSVELKSPSGPSSSASPSSTNKLELSGAQLDAALQYSASYGLAPLLTQLRALQQREHAPRYDSWQMLVTTGSQDALAKAFELVLDPGDALLVEDPTYSGALAALRPLRANLVPVAIDKDGLRPDALAKTLRMWPKDKKRARVLYTIPTGQNPSGVTTSAERRRAIYELACAEDLLVLEDDPYWFLQLSPSSSSSLPSYLSMDTQQRVLRFDSFSKVLSSGLRVGWATGPAPLLSKLEQHQQATSLHASGLAQAVVAQLLEHWGTQGFAHHVNTVQRYYAAQCNAFLESAERHLRGLCEWSAPTAGMFVWLKVLHPSVSDTQQLISERAVREKVLLVPGRAFSPNNEPSRYVRAAFSTATPAMMDEALSRFAKLLRALDK